MHYQFGEGIAEVARRRRIYLVFLVLHVLVAMDYTTYSFECLFDH